MGLRGGEWGGWEENEDQGGGILKGTVQLEVFISRFCGTIELNMGLALGKSAHDHDSGCLRGCDITALAEAQGSRYTHLLRCLPKARRSSGLSRKDFAVLSTHVLDLAALWITESPTWSARRLLVHVGGPAAGTLQGESQPWGAGVHAFLAPKSETHFSVYKQGALDLFSKWFPKSISWSLVTGGSAPVNSTQAQTTPPIITPLLSHTQGFCVSTFEGSGKGSCCTNTV